MARYQLAEVLGKSVAEISQLTQTEFNYWRAYYVIKSRAK